MSFQTAISPVYFEDRNLSIWKQWIKGSALKRVFVLADEHTAIQCLPLFKAATPQQVVIHEMVVRAGEQSKSLESACYIWNELLGGYAQRTDCMVNLGGGMITDLGGFSASLYKRGMRFVHFPTTLLAQVDASIGGKTGVDFGSFKNMIGTWSTPEAIFILPDFLSTLDERQIKNGWAEMMKHALIADADYWHEVKYFNTAHLISYIHKSVEIKKRIVAADPWEKNRRKTLNFGHTVGHALESYFLERTEQEVLHGEAIAAGMVCESWIATQCNKLPAEVFYEIENAIGAIYPRITFHTSTISELIDFMYQDKKNENQEIQMALIEAIGEALPQVPVSRNLVAQSLAFYLSR